MQRVLVPALGVLLLAACSGAAASSEATSIVTEPTSSTAPGVEPSDDITDVAIPGDGQPIGFERVRATVTTPGGEVCELCLWLAANADQRARGLMHVTDLGPADGMAFVYPEPRTGNFWMKDTILPLSIAFYGRVGAFLGSFDMEPCDETPCPRYRTATGFVVAVETVQGGLEELGMVSGSVLDLTNLPCP